MSVRVGEVIAVHGTKIILRIDEQSSKETIYYGGERFKGVSIREYLCIQRGFRDIICTVEGEYLDESRTEDSGGKTVYVRKVEARPIGYFEADDFKQGIKYLPMIQDPALLLEERRIRSIFERKDQGDKFQIGCMLKEGLTVTLPWRRLFNSHIGIFGNTGSGKSNTLTKLYTVLFEQKLKLIQDKSRFVILDFNGEYGGKQLAPEEAKQNYVLSTAEEPDPDSATARFPLSTEEFWNVDTLSLLFQATANTQRPFLNRVVSGKKKYERHPQSISAFAKDLFRKAFCAGEVRSASLDLMRTVARQLKNKAVENLLKQVSWHTRNVRFFTPEAFFDTDGKKYDQFVNPTVDTLDSTNLDEFERLTVRINLQLIADLTAGHVQFEHIQPLLKRAESSLNSLRRVLMVEDVPHDEKVLTVISLRRCNNDMKKVLPLLFAKHYYNAHKSKVTNPPNRTVHLIVDEAHNILSEQSTRESESWKDYRLEQFEEIIKEGRKFGVFVTIASQRPADISPTIVSQLHNFFIHRLVNDRDLFLVGNTISTLDALSRGLIPGLAQGCCVVTGTAFDLPMIIQVDRLPADKQPASEDVNLEILWSETPAVRETK